MHILATYGAYISRLMNRFQRKDEANARLLSHVRPPSWQAPSPASRYNLVVIGAGTAGLVCAAGVPAWAQRSPSLKMLSLGATV